MSLAQLSPSLLYPILNRIGQSPNIKSSIEPNIKSNIELNIEPNIELNIEPSIEPNIEPNINMCVSSLGYIVGASALYVFVQLVTLWVRPPLVCVLLLEDNLRWILACCLLCFAAFLEFFFIFFHFYFYSIFAECGGGGTGN